MKAAEVFCTATVTSKQAMGSKFAGKRQLYGKLAIEWKYEEAEAMQKNAKTVNADILKDLRQFRYLLPAEAVTKVNSWVKITVREYRLRSNLALKEDSADDEKPGGHDAKASSASSSSSYSDAVHAKIDATFKAAPSVVSDQAQVTQDSHAPASKAAMQKLFGTKAIFKKSV